MSAPDRWPGSTQLAHSPNLERVFELTGQILANLAAGRASGRVLLERDRLLWSLPDHERRLYFAWAAQEQPS